MVPEKILKRSLEHINYEVWMLKKCHSYLLCGQNLILTNALLESFAIHARNLFYFFYTNKSRRIKDDILADDFITNKKLFLALRTPKIKLKIILKKTDKQVVHITYARCMYNKRTKPWKFDDLYKKLETTIEAFKKSLPAERRDWFN